MKKFRNLPPFWRIAIPIVLVAVLASGTYFGYHQFLAPEPTTQDGQPVNLEPATEEEKAQTEAHKEEIIEQDNAKKDNPTSPSAGAKDVTVVITGADQSAGRAYVNGVFEDDGSCSATATLAGKTVTATSVGFRNVSYTQCAPLNWNTPLTPGNWNITVTYKSASAQGTKTSLVEVN